MPGSRRGVSRQRNRTARSAGRPICAVNRLRNGVAADELDMLEQAAQLHDIGKIGIPDAILIKPGKLLPAEFEIMQKHARFGNRSLERSPTMNPMS